MWGPRDRCTHQAIYGKWAVTRSDEDETSVSDRATAVHKGRSVWCQASRIYVGRQLGGLAAADACE